ncbi:MAG: LysR family transcriptional regulator [Chloroflexota bacterium]
MQSLDTIKLKTFYVIIQTGSFTKAAEVLNLTQPTVSQQIAILEKQIGAPLFIRQPRQLILTEAGETLQHYAERILTLCDEAVQNTRESANLAQQTIHLGVGHTLAIYLLPGLLRRLRERHQDIRPRIQVGNTHNLLLATADGHVDLALVGSPAHHPKLTITDFHVDSLVVIFPPDDPWRDRSFVVPEDFLSRTLITREKGSALHASVQAIFGSEHLEGPQTIILGETEAIKRSVEAGLGVALVQGIAIEREVAQGNLCTIPLHDAPIQRRYNIAQRMDDPPSPIVSEFLSLLLSNESMVQSSRN